MRSEVIKPILIADKRLLRDIKWESLPKQIDVLEEIFEKPFSEEWPKFFLLLNDPDPDSRGNNFGLLIRGSVLKHARGLSVKKALSELGLKDECEYYKYLSVGLFLLGYHKVLLPRDFWIAFNRANKDNIDIFYLYGLDSNPVFDGKIIITKYAGVSVEKDFEGNLYKTRKHGDSPVNEIDVVEKFKELPKSIEVVRLYQRRIIRLLQFYARQNKEKLLCIKLNGAELINIGPKSFFGPDIASQAHSTINSVSQILSNAKGLYPGILFTTGGSRNTEWLVNIDVEIL